MSLFVDLPTLQWVYHHRTRLSSGQWYWSSTRACSLFSHTLDLLQLLRWWRMACQSDEEFYHPSESICIDGLSSICVCTPAVSEQVVPIIQPIRHLLRQSVPFVSHHHPSLIVQNSIRSTNRRDFGARSNDCTGHAHSSTFFTSKHQSDEWNSVHIWN